MTVSFADALATLQAMFGDVDKEVISVILENNGGHMEKTVDDLLAMTGQGDNTTNPTSGNGFNNPNPPRNSGNRTGAGNDLPDDFLALPNGNGNGNGNRFSNDHAGMMGRPEEIDQIKSDAEFAKMLQDQMFMDQLQSHPEWRQQQQQQQYQPRQQQQQLQHQQQSRAGTTTTTTTTAAASTNDTMEQFKAKWNSLSETAKLKFSSLFASSNNNPSSNSAAAGNNAKYTSLPGDDEDEDDSDVLNFSNADMNRRNNNNNNINDAGETELQDTRTFKSASAGTGGKKSD